MRALIGLAANPAAPLAVLLRLVVVPEAADRIAWKQKGIPVALAERLLASSGSDVGFLRLLAEHPDAEVRDAWRETAAEWITNGPLDLPGVERFAGEGGLPALAVHEDPLFRAAVARTWTGMPDDIRRALLADPVAEVREAACLVRVPEDLHARLLADGATRGRVVSYAALTPQLAKEFAESDDAELRAELALNPTLPPEARDRLAEDPDPRVRASIVLREDTPESLRVRLYEDLVAEPDSDEDFLALMVLDIPGFGWARSLPLPQRLAHLDSPIPPLRRAATQSGFPPEVFARLDSHEDIAVRRNAAWRPDVPPSVLVRLVLDHGVRTKTRPYLVDHPGFPSEGYVALAASPHANRRLYALHGPDLPVDLVVALARDPEAYVRKAAAGHPRIPVACVETLLLDDDLDVVEAAGASPVLPEAVMVRLLDEAGL